jgi:hypothetical protein
MKDSKKAKLTYKNLERDIERRCVKTNELQMGIPILRGYDKARQEVFNSYLEKRLFNQVVDYLLTQNWEWGTNDYFERAHRALEAEEDIYNLMRLWQGVIASQEQNYWATDTVSNSSPENLRALRKVKEVTLAHMLRYREILFLLDERIEIEKLDQRFSQVKAGKRTKKGKPNEPQVMDIDLFWELIEKSHRASKSIPVQIEMITADLENLEPMEIIRFQELLTEKLCEAYSWDLWALAFIAQDGCSDDEFEYFRGWLILQGRELFTEALEDIHQALKYIPKGLETRTEGLLNLAETAYYSQTGENLPREKVPPCELKGSPWEEDILEILFPDVCKHYEFE